MKDDYRYYVATGVHFGRTLAFNVLDKNLTKLDFSADVNMIATGKTGFSVEKDGLITATCNQTMAYGVELNEIIYNKIHNRLNLKESSEVVRVRPSEGR